jgi:hypothetical protein
MFIGEAARDIPTATGGAMRFFGSLTCDDATGDDGDDRPERPSWLGVAAFAALCVAPVLAMAWATRGLYMWDGDEKLYSVFRVQQMKAAWLIDRDPAAWWMSDACWGQGWPFFAFYSPLGYMVAAAASVALGLGLGAATKLSFLASLALSGLLMGGLAWTLARRGGSRLGGQWALTAAYFYMLAPYHLTDVFVRQALAEDWAWPAMAGAMWAVEASRRRPGAAAGLAVAVAALILSHNISAIYGVLVIGAYVVATAPWGHGGLRWTTRMAAGGALGVALGAWFWLPAMRLAPLVRAGDPNALFGSPQWLQAQALYWPQFFIEQWGRGSNRIGMDDTLSLNPGALVMLGMLAAAWVLASDRLRPGTTRRSVAACLGIGLAAMFAMCHWMPWGWTPRLLRYIQFPWRLELFLVLMAVMALAAAGAFIERWARPWMPAAAALAWGATMLAIIFPGPVPDGATGDAEIVAWHRREEAQTGYIAGCNVLEYLPLWADARLADPAWQRDHPAPATRLEPLAGTEAKPLSGGASAGLAIERFQRRGASYSWNYAAPAEVAAKAHVLDFPDWRLEIDGAAAPARLGRAADGLVALRLPAGRHVATLRRARPPVAVVGLAISAAALAIWVAWLAWLACSALKTPRWRARF